MVVRELMAETEAGAGKAGAQKTSMLQDLEAGRPMELEAIAGAVVELGDKLGVPMPAAKTVDASAKMLDEKRRSAGLSPGMSSGPAVEGRTP